MDHISESLKLSERADSKIQPAIDVSNWLKNNDSKYLETRKRMTKRITQLIAADYIAKPDFPNFESLPPLKPLPFTTFGHQPLLNYQKLQEIIWDVISNIQNVTRAWKIINPLINLSILLGSLLVYVVIQKYYLRSSEDTLIALSLFLVFGFIIKYIYSDNIAEKIAATRAKALQTLLHYTYEVEDEIKHNEFIINSQKYVGSGEIGSQNSPVLTITSSVHPFPGFGRFQFDHLFLCKPDESRSNPFGRSETLSNNILIHVKSQLSVSGIENINFGEIFVVHANSLRANSPWLDAEKRPLLYVSRDMANKLSSLDSKVALREYFIVEILFEEFLTSGYFFFRPFMVGSYAACHLAINTLGPPVATVDDLERKLQAYKNQLLDIDKLKPDNISELDRGKVELKNIAQLKESEKEYESFKSKLNMNLVRECDIDKRYKMDQSEKQLYKSNYNKIVSDNIFWPGVVIADLFNTREEHSLTFTSDHFGGPESLASIKAVYQLISHSILDAMKENGYSVNEYINKDGKYSIRAENLDNLIVGENICYDKAEITGLKKTKVLES